MVGLASAAVRCLAPGDALRLRAARGGQVLQTLMSALTLLFVLMALVAGLAAAAHCFALARRGTVVSDAGRRPAWGRFHVRYYVFALLFIAFDMEMAYMYPWAVVLGSLGWFAFAEIGFFLTVLGLGVAYAWREGGLEWS